MAHIPDHDRNPDLPVADLTKAPLPTGGTLRNRRSIPAQLVRFALTNLRMARLAFSKH
mgnify:CR=1 FL=1